MIAHPNYDTAEFANGSIIPDENGITGIVELVGGLDVYFKDVKTSRTAISSRSSFKTEKKSAQLEEQLDRYDILGSKSEFSRHFFKPTYITNG